MGLSLFFRNKWIFWLWIFIPLLIRMAFVTGLAAMERSSANALVYEQTMEKLVPELESALKKSKEALKEFEPFEDMSSQERFLTDFSKLLFDLGLEGQTKIGKMRPDKKSDITTYNFEVTGKAPDLPALSRLLDQASLVEYLRVFSCYIDKNNRKDESSYNFELVLKRSEIQSGGRK